jgi:hypothetical protein
MIGGVARRVDGAQRPAVALDHRIVGQRDVGPEGLVIGGVQCVLFADSKRPGLPVRSLGDRERARLRLQPRRQGGVVAMRVGDEDVADGPAADCRRQRTQMRLILGAGIALSSVSSAS